MKNTLLPLLRELIEQPDHLNLAGLKFSIMMSAGFLMHPRTVGEISNLLKIVNSYIRSPDDKSKSDVLKIIERIEEKTT